MSSTNGSGRRGMGILDWPGRHPVAALITLQSLVFFFPNGAVQAAVLHPGWLQLILVLLLNFSIILAFTFLFRTPRSARWALLPLAVVALYTTDFIKSFGGMPSVGTYLSLGHTTLQEGFSYLKVKWQVALVLALLSWGYFKAYSAVSALCRPEHLARARKPVLCVCIGYIALFANWDTWLIKYEPGRVESDSTPRKNGFPLGFVLSANHAYWYCRGLKLANNDYRFHASRTAPVTARETYVLVIGESASAKYWSLGGYPYDTNSRIRKYQEAGDLVYFPRTAAQANVTALAVPMIITASTPTEFLNSFKIKSILGAFKEVGFTTFWISNQDEVQHMTEADFPILLHPRGGFIYTNYDEELLPYLDALLASPRQKVFVVLHLMGSHIYYEDRVPKGFQTPGLTAAPEHPHEAAQDSDYVRSICYTDYFLDGVIQRLSRVPGRSFIWYVSDHGQIIHPGEVGHGSIATSASELHVPMFLWTNRAFRDACAPQLERVQAHSREVLSQGVTFPTFLGLGGVNYPGLDHTRDLSSDAFVSGLAPPVMTGEAQAKQIDDFLAKIDASRP